MAKYILTNVRFTEKEHERLRHMAVHERRSMAEIVREAVSTYIEQKQGKTLSEKELANDPFSKVIGIGRSGMGDISVRHDEILYGSDTLRNEKWEARCDRMLEGGNQESRGGR